VFVARELTAWRRARILFAVCVSKARELASSRQERQPLTSDVAVHPDDPTPESLAELPEVGDWSRARRNPFAGRTYVRVLPSDLPKQLPDNRSVADALRACLNGIRKR
jgi:hypothetical protein